MIALLLIVVVVGGILYYYYHTLKPVGPIETPAKQPSKPQKSEREQLITTISRNFDNTLSFYFNKPYAVKHQDCYPMRRGTKNKIYCKDMVTEFADVIDIEMGTKRDTNRKREAIEFYFYHSDDFHVGNLSNDSLRIIAEELEQLNSYLWMNLLSIMPYVKMISFGQPKDAEPFLKVDINWNAIEKFLVSHKKDGPALVSAAKVLFEVNKLSIAQVRFIIEKQSERGLEYSVYTESAIV